MRKKQSKCFSCPTAFPMFGGKLGNRTPALSLSVKEVTLIYLIILNFGCCRYKMTFMICQLTGSVQAPATRIELAWYLPWQGSGHPAAPAGLFLFYCFLLCVLTLWQLEQTISHFAISLLRVSSETHFDLYLAIPKPLSLRWSKSITYEGKYWPQSAHGVDSLRRFISSEFLSLAALWTALLFSTPPGDR